MRVAKLIAITIVLLSPMHALARPVPGSFADMVERLSPAVVNISTTQKVQSGGNYGLRFHGLPGGEDMAPFKEFFEKFGDQFGDAPAERDVTSLGSGFVIDPSGYIVTNNHVIEQAEEVTVTFQDETQYIAEVVGTDSKTDLALLKIEAERLPYVEFGDSDDMRVGDWVVAIGNPFGLGGSVSAGIVSARSRNINAGPFDDFIQTDAAINRGNSGGPLFNVDGEVIGVNSAIFSPSGGNVGIGFSIPSALAKPVLQQLKEFGRTHRGWLGVKIQHVTEELAEGLGLRRPKGALVLEVQQDSPAANAGVQMGDVILEFDGRSVEEMRHLPRMVAETKIGKTVDLVVWRNEKTIDLQVTLGELKEEGETEQAATEQPDKKKLEDTPSDKWMGAEVAKLNDSLRQRAGLADDVEGIIVLNVEPGSAAFDAKLLRADVIVEANQRTLQSVDDLKEAIEQARKDGKSHALLRIDRRGTKSFTTIATQEKK